MPETDINDLVAALLRETATKKLRWSTTADANAFRVAFPAGVVRIQFVRLKTGEHFYMLVVSDPKGVLLEQRSSKQPGSEYLADLYKMARGSALNLDDTLRNLLSDIREGRQVEPPPEDQDDEL
jgi:hypothetical protein